MMQSCCGCRDEGSNPSASTICFSLGSLGVGSSVQFMLRRTPFKRKTPLRAKGWMKRGSGIKRGGRISPISDRRRREGAIYSKERVIFLLANPLCVIHAPGCTCKSEVVHHSKGRVGPLFLDKRWWMASCSHCNLYLENNKEWGIKHGFRLDRLATVEAPSVPGEGYALRQVQEILPHRPGVR